jgi:acyl-CoA thioesterase I
MAPEPRRARRGRALILVAALVAACESGGGELPNRRALSASALRILPLGDSITEGGPGAATYRYWLQKDLESRGLEVDFVGSQRGVHGGEPRFDDFDQDHQGHWGWTSDEVAARIDEWAREANADLALVHLGSNDLLRSARGIPANLARIVAGLREANPTVVVFLARLIPPAGFPTLRLRAVNDAIEALAGELSTAVSPVIVVAQDEGFRPGVDTLDGVHPNEQGEQKMAAKWAEAIHAWRSSRGG